MVGFHMVPKWEGLILGVPVDRRGRCGMSNDVERDGCGDEAVPGYLPWIMAVADDARESWWERAGGNPKRMGELSQAAFLVRAQRLGFGLALPWGDSEKCDFIVWARPGGRLLRVQVKGTGRLYRGGYDVQPVCSTRVGGRRLIRLPILMCWRRM